MDALIIGLISTFCIVCGMLAGIGLQKVLPKHHLSSDSKDTVKICSGLLATFTALVLGLLVSSAKSSFDSTNAALVQSGAQIIMFDHILAAYGPETKEIRAALRQSLSAQLDRIWPRQGPGGGLHAVEASHETQSLQLKLSQLQPQTATQQALLAQAQQLANQIAQERWSVIEQMQTVLPTPLLAMLIAWTSMLFLSFGLFAPRNATVLISLCVCAISVSSAICLVLELNRPLDGFIRVSDAPMRKVLDFIGK